MKDKYSVDMPRFGEPEEMKKKKMSEEASDLVTLVVVGILLLLVGGFIYTVGTARYNARQGPWPAKYEMGQLVEVDDSPLVFEITKVWWQRDSECSQYKYLSLIHI